MPSVIAPIREGRETGAVTYTLTLLKGDGSPGEVQFPPVFTLEPAELGSVNSSNVSPGVFSAEVVHNGSVGQAVLTAGQVDGDLGAGEVFIGPFTDTVEFRGDLGAESGTFTAGPQHAPGAATPATPPVEPPVV
jgi:hypothetical protein